MGREILEELSFAGMARRLEAVLEPLVPQA
jgi:hypothetical protein